MIYVSRKDSKFNFLSHTERYAVCVKDTMYTASFADGLIHTNFWSAVLRLHRRGVLNVDSAAKIHLKTSLHLDLLVIICFVLRVCFRMEN